MWTHTAAELHTRLLVIGEDQLLVRQLQGSLASQGWELVVTGRGQQGLTLIEQVCPDLVLLSAPLPDLDAYELCRQLRRRVGYALPILLLSSHDEVTEKVAALESGADDYITEPCDRVELLAHLRAALRRWQIARPELIEVADLRMEPAARQAWRAGNELKLTKHENDLLELLARHAGQVLPKEIILQRGWGNAPEVGPQVLKVYISALRKKLRRDGQPPLIATRRGIGYLLRERESLLSRTFQ
jgi:two-component system, OmpR family, response regulator MprA